MGYETSFNLHIRKMSPEPMTEKEQEEIENMIDDKTPLEGDFENGWYKDDKWYFDEFESVLCEISSEFPDYLFVLHGVGEEENEIWIEYFMRGMLQFELARLQLNGFNPSKLEPYREDIPHYVEDIILPNDL